MSTEKKVVLTCAQPSGKLHIGNYLGAIRNWAEMLDEYDCYFGIVDMHAITAPYVPAELRRSSIDTLALYVACGLDPERCRLFLQSHVTGHAELAWVLGCVTPLGQLERMTQFKDKARRQGGRVNAGLLYYPVLMAADILLYNADLVPVGDDQKQHVELCRDVAQKFNNTYSETFRVPDIYVPPTGARIRSLQEPENKMSKSDANANGSLYLLDEPRVLRKKIMSAVTDSGSEIVARDDKPGVSNLLMIWSAAAGRPIRELEEACRGLSGYAPFKEQVADAVVALIDPIRERYHAIAGDKSRLESILAEGAQAAQKRAWRTLSKVTRKVGFVERPRV